MDTPQGSKVTENIVLGTDGKYHWFYEFKLLRNAAILKLLWKLFFWIFLGIWAFLCFISLCQGHIKRDFINLSETFLAVTAGFEVLVALGYFVYAAIMGFKYCVMFEMDENGVTHTQMPKQFKKAQALSLLTIFAGLAGGKPGVVGTGILSGTKQSMVSTWSAVRRVEIYPKKNLIKVNERLNHNQVYAEDADFQFVADFIRSHVPQKCEVTE